MGIESRELPLYSEIKPGLYMGGTYDDASIGAARRRLPTINDVESFDAVVTLDAYSLPMGFGVREFRYAFPDASLGDEHIKYLERAADWAYLEWKEGSRVLIRCQAGINRSGLVTALVLMRDRMRAKEAIELIRKQRSQYCLENQSFVDYLLEEL